MTDVVIRRPVRRRPSFHPLAVAAVDRLTDAAVAITFAVPPELRALYAFRPGQYLTVRMPGADVRRSYSICSTPADLDAAGHLRVGVKEVPGGAFSSVAVRGLRPGDTVEVLPPLGDFTTAFAPERVRRYAAVAAGSGITPVLSLIATGLAVEPAATFTLVYGNSTAGSTMFAAELADLHRQHPDRLRLLHVLSREPGETPLLSGRIDAARTARILDTVPVGDVDEWFLCGPFGMVTDVRTVLEERGAALVHQELFFSGDEPPGRQPRST